jgi:hypothetical protein
MTKLTKQWSDLPRFSKLASVMYPNLADPETRSEMDQISKAEGKRSPTQQAPLLSDRDRGAVSPLGGQAIGRE